MKELTLHEQYILLTILELKEEAFLLNIRDRIKDITGKEFALGTIYVPLERLKRLGYLSVRIVKPAPKVGGRSVKYYRMTGEGMQVLQKMKQLQDRLWEFFPGTVSVE